MILFVATTLLPFWDMVVEVDRVFKDPEDADVSVEEDILEDRGPCPIILFGKGSLEVLVDVDRVGAV